MKTFNLKQFAAHFDHQRYTLINNICLQPNVKKLSYLRDINKFLGRDSVQWTTFIQDNKWEDWERSVGELDIDKTFANRDANERKLANTPHSNRV